MFVYIEAACTRCTELECSDEEDPAPRPHVEEPGTLGW